MENIILNYGLFFVFIFMVTNGIFSAPPSEVTLAAGGVWAYYFDQNLMLVIIIGFFGNLFGAIVLYFFGKYLGYEWIVKFKKTLHASKKLSKLHVIFPSKKRLSYFNFIFKERGYFSVAVFRCFPAVRSIISLPAGMFKMPLFYFIFFSSLGIFLWVSFWSFLGYFAYESWRDYKFPIVVFLMLILVSFLLFLKFFLRKDYVKWEKSNYLK